MLDNADYRARTMNLLGPDHYPACPGCGDLCGLLAQRCANCGAQLYADPPPAHVIIPGRAR